MSVRILAPYELTTNEKNTVSSDFKTHKDWEKGSFDSLKQNLITDLRPKQKNKCCYCKSELGFDIKAVDIEHILPKSKYEKFTFHPKNLALSCPGCNTSKSSKEVLKRPIKIYPRSGSNILIVHAHFDDYSSSIEIHSNAIYEGLDDKGCETIKQCKLYRLKTVQKKAKEANSKKSPIQELVESLRNAPDDEKKQLVNELSQLTNDFNGS
jgi:5-methylcytosine-specific restriction endonuclease McrA